MEVEKLSPYEKRLCNALQKGLPAVGRPFARTAESLRSDEKRVIETTRGLLKRGVIRRIGAVVNWRAAGKASTLVTAHIEEGDIGKVVKAVNSLEGVSHNYLRKHRFNLWFTLRADSQEGLAKILRKLSKRFGVRFFSLPVTRAFKLDVRFDAESGGRLLLPGDGRRRTEDGRRTSEIDRRILDGLQKGLKVVKRPFDFLGEDDLEIADKLLHIEEMINEGTISRLGAVVNHRKLGFTANAMFVCRIDTRRVDKAGRALADLQIVSHCYERKPFKGWPYNLFGMMHGKYLGEIRATAAGFVKKQKIARWELLETAEEFKKGNS